MGKYWPETENSTEVNRTEDIIRAAIKEIEDDTGNRIRGTFSKIEYRKIEEKTAVDVLQQLFTKSAINLNAFQRLREERIVEIEDEELRGKEDINAFHNPQVYKFEIYTEKYKFRIFQIINSDAFPVRVVLDQGIADELEMTNSDKEIASNDEMERLLRRIFRTIKVRNIKNQLLVLANAEKDEKINHYFDEHEEGTVAEIAKRIKWSQSLTRERLDDMEESGLVETENVAGKAAVWRRKITDDSMNESTMIVE